MHSGRTVSGVLLTRPSVPLGCSGLLRVCYGCLALFFPERLFVEPSVADSPPGKATFPHIMWWIKNSRTLFAVLPSYQGTELISPSLESGLPFRFALASRPWRWGCMTSKQGSGDLAAPTLALLAFCPGTTMLRRPGQERHGEAGGRGHPCPSPGPRHKRGRSAPLRLECRGTREARRAPRKNRPLDPQNGKK